MSVGGRHRVGRDASFVVVSTLLLLPIVVFALYAFSQRWFYPQVLPHEWTVGPLGFVLADPQTIRALFSSLVVATAVTLVSLAVAWPAGRALGMREFPGKGLVLLLVFLPTVVPPVAVGMGLNILFLRIGLAGTGLGVTLVHLIPTLPYVLFSLTAFFTRYDRGYEEQATVLGAGPVRVFLRIALPLARPGLAVAAVFAFLVSWSQYLLTLLIGGGRVITLPMLLFSAAAGGDTTTVAVLSLVFVAPPILLIGVAARYLGGPQDAGEVAVPL